MIWERVFHLREKGTTPRRECVAGLTTFMTMAYVLVIIPQLLATTGMDQGALFSATALASIVATLVMAFYANMPYALAPGLGLTAFFAYTVVGEMGYSWQTALTAVFLEGLLFILLTVTNAREAIVKAIPSNLKHAISVGIGLFITLMSSLNKDKIDMPNLNWEYRTKPLFFIVPFCYLKPKYSHRLLITDVFREKVVGINPLLS